MEAPAVVIASRSDLQLYRTSWIYGRNRHLTRNRSSPRALCKQEVTGSIPTGSINGYTCKIDVFNLLTRLTRGRGGYSFVFSVLSHGPEHRSEGGVQLLSRGLSMFTAAEEVDEAVPGRLGRRVPKLI